MSVINTSGDSNQGEQTQIKVKEPKRILHFSDGTLEEYSSDEEVDQVDTPAPVQEIPSDWMPWVWYTTSNIGHKTLAVCDSLGEYLADFFGITSPKYQAELEYYKESLKKSCDNCSCNSVEMNKNNPAPVTV